MQNDIAIRVSNVSKKYLIGKQKDSSLRGSLQGVFNGKSAQVDEFKALNDVSFDIKKGDIVGIIGKNGAGKSTLLKILSQITKPTSGLIEINGRVASLLEVGTGFHPELTGRENIFLNGTILGMTRKEVSSKFDEIVEFSGVEKFIDTPVKHYSSGMHVRLAFAVAAHLEPEILIIDEVLAVGDAEFQKKCLGKMKDVAGEGRTVIFVSHNLGSIRLLCTRGILIDKGEIKETGDINSVILSYQNVDLKNTKFVVENKQSDCYVAEASIDTERNEFYSSEDISFIFKIACRMKIINSILLLIRILDDMDQVIGCSEIELNDSQDIYKLLLLKNTLTKGSYKLNCIIYQPSITQFDNVAECCDFEILDNNLQFAHLESFDIGKVYLPNKWIL